MDNVSLKEYFNVLVEHINEKTRTAYTSMEKRLEGMNEFRDTLKDQAGRFVTREELNLIADRLEADIKNLQLTRSEMLSIDTYNAAHSDLQKQVDDLRISKAVLEGKASQSQVNIALIISVIGIVIGVIGILTKFL